MNVLVLNCGSSSLKFQLISTSLEQIEQNADQTLAKGHIERIGGAATLNFSVDGRPPVRSGRPIRDIKAALDAVLQWIASDEAAIEGVGSLADIQAVGHRVVHGGEKF
jgi:acetate kinase